MSSCLQIDSGVVVRRGYDLSRDISPALLWVFSGCSSKARTSAFQADDVGSIPITRSIWLVLQQPEVIV